MINKKKRPKKAVLRVDKSKLIEQLNSLYLEGKEMAALPVIDVKAYDTWFENIKGVLQLSFKGSNNEFYKKFIPLPSEFYFSPDNGSSAQIDDQIKWKSYLGGDLNRLNSIIVEISTLY